MQQLVEAKIKENYNEENQDGNCDENEDDTDGDPDNATETDNAIETLQYESH